MARTPGSPLIRAASLVAVTATLSLVWIAAHTGAADATTRAAASSTTSTTAAANVSAGDQRLDALMLSVPLPGLSDFSLVGPGATNGPLTAQTLGSYSNDPAQVENLYGRYSAQSGFAGWIKTWQDKSGQNQVVEIAIRFHSAAQARSNDTAFVSTLSKGLSGGARSHYPSIPGSTAFTIDESATTQGTTDIPAQQVQAIVFSAGNYLVVLHTDSPNGPGTRPIAAGTAGALAFQQYQVLLPVIRQQSGATKQTPPPKSSAGSTVRTVGIALLAAVALAVLVIAFVTARRRRRSEPGRAGPEVATGKDVAKSPDVPRRSPEPIGSGTSNGSSRRDVSNGRATKDGHKELVGAASASGRRTRSRRDANRAKHPSALTALEQSVPPDTSPGWYEDPTDERHLRIRYWDGSAWTTHVAEPET